MSIENYENLLYQFENVNKQLLDEAKKLYNDIEKSKYSFLLSKDLKTFEYKKIIEAGYYFENKFEVFFSIKDLHLVRFKYQELQSYIDDLERMRSKIDLRKYKDYYAYLIAIYKLKNVVIDRLPARFKSYLHKQQVNGEAHLNVIKKLMDDKEKDEENSIQFSSLNDLTKAFNESLTNYNVMKSLQHQIVKMFGKYRIPMMKNQWKIPLYSNQILNYLECNLLDTSNNTESDVAICDFIKSSKYLVLKCAKVNSNEYDVLLHEFVIGSLLNKLRSDTNNFCYTYFGFFCTPFNQGIEEMCRITDSDHALSTIVALEYCGQTSLYEFFKNATVQEQYSTLLQLLCSLCIAQEKYKFVHGDLHSNNIFIRRMPRSTQFKYNLKNIELVINVNTSFLPQIIDYGRSIVKVDNILLLPFFVIDQPQIQSAYNQIPSLKKIEDYVTSQGLFVSSFDWLRLLISLTNVIHIQVLQIFTKVYYEKVKKQETNLTKWLKTIHQSSNSIKVSKFDLLFHEDLEMCFIDLHDVILSLSS